MNSGRVKVSKANFVSSFICSASGSCSIQFENYVIIIGGLINSVGSQSVEKYDDTGFLNSLPDIGTQRTYASCGYYYKNGDLVKYLSIHQQ